MSDENNTDMDKHRMPLYVLTPKNDVYKSFGEATHNSRVRIRSTRAKGERPAIAGRTIISYSYSLSSVRLNYGDACLEIFVNGNSVDWIMRHEFNQFDDSCDSINHLIYADTINREKLFERDKILAKLVGMRAWHSPSTSDLFVVWQPDMGICFSSLKYADHDGYMLYYS